jgi:thiamine pyrophosphate-dependent acetolactate synthase large subunit-like protein
VERDCTSESRLTGAARLADAIADAGIDVVFGLPGVQNLAAWPALEDRGVRIVGVRHEQAAGYAGDGFARMSGSCGIALTTTGPGAANVVCATGEAWASGIPLVVIATDIPSDVRQPGEYRGVLHECTDQASLFAAVTKARLVVTKAVDIYATVRRAITEATTAPPRPVYVEIPSDFLRSDGGAKVGADWYAVDSDLAPADPVLVAQAALLVGASLRPLIWVGGGVASSGAGELVSTLARLLGAPIMSTYAGRGVGASAGDLDLQLPPHFEAVGAIWDDADFVLAVGSGFDGMMTQNWAMPRPPKLVIVDIASAQAHGNYAGDVVLENDASVALDALIDELPRDERRPWARGAADLWNDVAAVVRSENPRELAFVEAVIDGSRSRRALFADLCIAGYWLSALHPARHSRFLAYPMGWGTLGYALQGAIGAATVIDTNPVVVTGDGGVLFGIAEFATLAQEELPVTVVIVDDGAYGMLRYDQIHLGDRLAGVDLKSPDFAGIAESFGLASRVVELDQLGDAIACGVASGDPNVIVLRERFDPPPTVSVRWYRKGD